MNDTLKIILSIVVVIVCAFMFVGTYLLNKNQKKPDGCDETSCTGCAMVGCSNRKENEEKEKTNNE